MNDSRRAPFPYHRLAAALFCVLSVSLLAAVGARAQSQDLAFPTPVTTNELSGTIAARDIGDARLTRHFYILAGGQGDLVITVTSNNLNGDVDLFTAGSLRPLGKISVYAGASPTTAARTIFLRQRESLILRVEARSANDNEGSYSIRFAGTFEPVLTAPTPPAQEAESSANNTRTDTERTQRNVRRVTSAGARIDEPEPEPSARTETTTEPQPTTNSTAPAATETATERTAPVEPPAKRRPVRTTRASRPGRRRARAAAQPSPQPTTSEPSATTPTPSATEAASTDAPALNPRLIIETRDGMRTERFMSTVRSVTVRNGQVVVVASDGKTERISLASILRMSIEP
ncbi:MAG TPA: hypothetical protein VGX92_22045 [Pyrinomonadaceae bacterium]|jgi:hypothetical protein|nr:hypothetical protein [Pyrinomonadaceae bacterium]